MILLESIQLNQITVVGIDTSLLSVDKWYHALMAAGATLQRVIRDHYARERGYQVTAIRKFRKNSKRWNARKARMGWDARRGHMMGRIARALGAGQLYSVSSIIGGRATITLNEGVLRQMVPHARFYARRKIDGARILQIAPAWAKMIVRRLNAIQSAAINSERNAMRERFKREAERAKSLAAAEREAYKEAAWRDRASEKFAKAMRRVARSMEGQAYREDAQRERAHLNALDAQAHVRVDPRTGNVEVEYFRSNSFKRRVTLAATAWRTSRKAATKLARLGVR